MEQELRRVYYDPELGVEACLFQGIDQGFRSIFTPIMSLEPWIGGAGR